MPRQPKRPRVLILGRMPSLVDYAARWADELGFEAQTALTNEDALKLMDEGPWTCAIFGCVFKNAEQHRKECDEMRAALKDRNIRAADMPTFGNVREALFELKLIEEELVNGKSVIKPVANWAEMFSAAAIAG